MEPFLLSERRRKSSPAHNSRRYLNGMLHDLRVCCLWRDMQERYGKWNSVYVRFRRWAEHHTGDGLLEPLVEFGLPEECRQMIDSTIFWGWRAYALASAGETYFGNVLRSPCSE
ncbi:transposase [Aliirhizobium smilacinae]|uniref:Transposase n=1 Tax=Aliirhizobium smilacinae TaxID=1395944 RepID=A0A5C4XTN4_9HYPH|nr:transposase [Rhizobium smilacinae]